MRGTLRPWWATLALTLSCLPVSAQSPKPEAAPPPADAAPAPAPPPSTPVTPPPPADAIAATVNGQPISEMAVYRGLQRVPVAKHTEARPELINYLIDNLLVEQYLQQMSVTVDPKEVDKRIDDIRGELAKKKQDFDKMLKEMHLTEAELREFITADLRWDKFADEKATDKVLRELFDAQRYLFDGSQVRARHILLTPAKDDPNAAREAIAQIQEFRKQLEASVAETVAKLSPDSDALTREKARTAALDEAFAALAKQKSACPSKAQGGDVGWFQGVGFMVEPFSRAAFSLKTFDMSEPVKTQFGYHLILPIDRKAGRDVKFEDVKEMVKEYYCSNLRETIAAQARERAKISINPPAKP